MVSPGKYLSADGSGIDLLACDKAAVIAASAEIISRREALMTKAVLAGKPIRDVMGADYEKCWTRSAAIRRRRHARRNPESRPSSARRACNGSPSRSRTVSRAASRTITEASILR